MKAILSCAIFLLLSWLSLWTYQGEISAHAETEELSLAEGAFTDSKPLDIQIDQMFYAQIYLSEVVNPKPDGYKVAYKNVSDGNLKTGFQLEKGLVDVGVDSEYSSRMLNSLAEQAIYATRKEIATRVKKPIEEVFIEGFEERNHDDIPYFHISSNVSNYDIIYNTRVHENDTKTTIIKATVSVYDSTLKKDLYKTAKEFLPDWVRSSSIRLARWEKLNSSMIFSFNFAEGTAIVDVYEDTGTPQRVSVVTKKEDRNDNTSQEKQYITYYNKDSSTDAKHKTIIDYNNTNIPVRELHMFTVYKDGEDSAPLSQSGFVKIFAYDGTLDKFFDIIYTVNSKGGVSYTNVRLYGQDTVQDVPGLGGDGYIPPNEIANRILTSAMSKDFSTLAQASKSRADRSVLLKEIEQKNMTIQQKKASFYTPKHTVTGEKVIQKMVVDKK